MKAYSHHRPLDELWLTSIPAHWQSRKIKHLFSERAEKGYPDEPLLVASQSMGVVPKSIYGNRTVEATKDLHNLKLVQIGDFVISLRSFQGGIEYAYYKGIISPAYTVMVPNTLISSGYFRFVAKSRLFIELLQMCVTGIREGQNIDYRKLKEHLIPVPPRDEQDQIVRFLDWKVSRINKLINAKRRQVALLQEQKRAVINAAVTKGHYNYVTLRRLSQSVKTGGTPSGAADEFYCESGFNWYTPGDFSDNIYLGQSSRQLSQLGKQSVTVFPPRSIMMIGIGGTMGKTAINLDYCSCNQQINVIIPTDKVYAEYLLYYLRAKPEDIFNTAKYTTLPILNQEDTKNILVPLPPLNEQRAIVAELDEKCGRIDHLVAAVQREVELLHEYRTRLISDVVTGKLDVRGVAVPEYEAVEETADTTEEEIVQEELAQIGGDDNADQHKRIRA
jgi:type I restriction enzyme S subunit